MLQFIHQSATVIFFQKPRSVCFNPVSKGCPTACKIAPNFCFYLFIFCFAVLPLMGKLPFWTSLFLSIYFSFFAVCHYIFTLIAPSWLENCPFDTVPFNRPSLCEAFAPRQPLYHVLFPRRMLAKESREAWWKILMLISCAILQVRKHLHILVPSLGEWPLKQLRLENCLLMDFEQCRCQPNIWTCPPHFLLEPACSVDCYMTEFTFFYFPICYLS